jgi:NAD(P)H-flavin reductase/uncharacterized membrane protein
MPVTSLRYNLTALLNLETTPCFIYPGPMLEGIMAGVDPHLPPGIPDAARKAQYVDVVMQNLPFLNHSLVSGCITEGKHLAIRHCHDQCDALRNATGGAASPFYNFEQCAYNLLGCCDCDGEFTFKYGTAWTARYESGYEAMGWVALVFTVLAVLVALPLTFVTKHRQTSSLSTEDDIATTQLPAGARASVPSISLGWALPVASSVGRLFALAFGSWVLIFLWLSGVGVQGQPYLLYTQSGVGLFLHSTGGSIWALSGALQFTAALRQRWPRAHRVTGYAYALSEVVSVIGLVILACSPHLSGLTAFTAGGAFSALWLTTLTLAIRAARQGRVRAHKLWMTRNLWLGMSVAWQRIFNLPPLANLINGKDEDYFPMCSPDQPSAVTLGGRSLTPQEINFSCANASWALAQSSGLFWLIFVYVGLFGCEVWLWVRHGDGYLASWLGPSQTEYVIVSPPPPPAPHGDAMAEVRTSPPPPAISPLPPRALHVRRQFSGGVRVLSRTPAAEQGTFVITCALPHPSLFLAVPPGHHLNIAVPAGQSSRRVWRPYSPLRTTEPGILRFLIRHVPNGVVSSFLTTTSLDALREDGAVHVDGPHGDFSHAPVTYRRIGLVAGGSGLAPLLSVVQVSLEDPLDTTAFTLICCNSTEADIPLEAELSALTQAHPHRLKLHHVLSRPSARSGLTPASSGSGAVVTLEISSAPLVSSHKRGNAPPRGEFYSERFNRSGEIASPDAPITDGDTSQFHPGRPTVDLLKQILPPPDEFTQVLVCGNPGFNRSILKKLRETGHSTQRTFAFGTTDR